MKTTGYAYPWDLLDDPEFLRRVRTLGLDEVAVAVAYHSTRAATPWSTRHAAVLARRAALYRPVREGAWRGRPLRPSPPDWVAREDSAGDAVRALNTAGIPAAAWIVLTHNSALGLAQPDVAVRNCFGETYPWALCPAQPAVREYAATLTAEAVHELDLSSVILEACGPLGAVHQHQHEKTEAVWAPSVARLLSVCCCTACASGWADSGLAPERVRNLLRTEVGRLIATGDLILSDDGLPPALCEALLATRQCATDALRAEVLSAVPRGTRIVLHGALDPWATGALPGLTPCAVADADAIVFSGWAPEHGAETVAAARAALPEHVAVGSYVSVAGAQPIPDIGSYVSALSAAGAKELHLYHLGLAGPGRRPELRTAVSVAHALSQEERRRRNDAAAATGASRHAGGLAANRLPPGA
ncbi:hypothetical protein ACFYYR_25515 [Streptomyces sp. NPDC001922]|uniref:hypothetical protein n=1 Tax=Streptomyces sp. NPDC001922 TaxID=3364624 RepID=UPI0036A37917